MEWLHAIPMDQILIQTVNGIVTGMILALVGSGLTLIFGIMDVVNFAHGELFMLGAYVGVTADLARRAWLHKAGAGDGFTKRYAVSRLVYVEFHETMIEAIKREKQIKKWRTTWKLELIETMNPQWMDLAGNLPM